MNAPVAPTQKKKEVAKVAGVWYDRSGNENRK
jgi:hypothetical protein